MTRIAYCVLVASIDSLGPLVYTTPTTNTQYAIRKAMVTNMLLRLARLPGADMFLSFIGRRILSSFSLIRGAILVMGVANVLLFQYLDHAEAQERNKLAEQGKLDHLSFVLQTQIKSYESAVWQTG